MFAHLREKIKGYVLISVILFTAIIVLVSFTIVGNSFYQNFKNAAEEHIAQSIKNSTFMIESAHSVTIQISQNNEIIDTLGRDEYNPRVNPILNMLKNTSFGIAGVTLYTENNRVYSTSSISEFPELMELRTNREINAFMDSDKVSFLSVRTSAVAGFYNHVKYDSRYGIITHIVKLYDRNRKIRGYLLVDIKPGYVYNSYFSYSAYPDYRNLETYIVSADDSYLKSEQNSAEHDGYIDTTSIKEGIRLSADKRFLISTKRYLGSSRVVTLIPMKPFYTLLIKLGAVLLVIAFILIVFSRITANILADYIIDPLSRLLKKMNETFF